MIRIRELRKQHEITAKKLGEAINVAESTVSLYENGKRAPDYDTLCKIADYFNVSVDYLLGREGKKEKLADKADEPIDQTNQTILNLLKLFPQEERQAIIAELAARLAEKK